MKKTILTFGLISGAISAGMLAVTMTIADRIGTDRGYYIGYTTIVLSMLLVFFGVRSYRDNHSQGQISFGKAFLVAISITLISCICYVVAWEIVYFNFMPDFMDKYIASLTAKANAPGANVAAIQAQILKMQKIKPLYNNVFFNAAMTFIEPFPVGLLVSLISAAVLRKKKTTAPIAHTAVA